MEAKRRPNFSEKEKLALLDLIRTKYPVLVNTQKGTTIKRTKEESWKKLILEYNVEDITKRSIEELKTLLANLLQRGKKEITNHRTLARATGGGPPPTPLTPVAELIQNLIPQTFESLDIPDSEIGECKFSIKLFELFSRTFKCLA